MDRRIKYTIGIIEKNYARPIALPVIAAQVHLSLSRFEHLFKQEVGQTFKAYLRTVRLQKALEALDHTTFSIKQIARRVGYSDMTNFTHAFKKQFGQPPSAYRRALAKDLVEQ